MNKSLATPAAAEQMVHRVRKVAQEAERQWGRMNAHQMICHCTDQIRMATGELPVADSSNFLSRSLIKFLVLYVISAPKGKVQTLPELDQNMGGTPPAQFEEDRNTLCHYIQLLASDRVEVVPHGYFGPLSLAQWQRLAWTHLDHHLRQFGA